MYSFLLNSIDVNECEDNSHTCDPNANCTNTEGSYDCACHESFFGNGLKCQSETRSCQFTVASYNQHTIKYLILLLFQLNAIMNALGCRTLTAICMHDSCACMERLTSCVSLVPRPSEEEEEEGPGTYCLCMHQIFRKNNRIIFRTWILITCIIVKWSNTCKEYGMTSWPLR